MKKVALLVLAAGMFAVVACGPSAKEKAAKEREKFVQDSIKQAEEQKRIQDSIMAAQAADTTKTDSTATTEVK